MVRIRLKRTGRTNRPSWRIAVFDQRTRRDGTDIEVLGSYDPLAKDDSKKVSLNKERAEYWLGKGAQPTRTVARFFANAGIAVKK
ncbi:MAG TPA: 30S ribosomal protein S16 [Candidatus Brocadiia bacterium]|nr:30S ribosomal protein S16 [Candidatus Brocadiia bacterium]